MGSLPPEPSSLFERARSSSEEYRKALTAMSTGSLAVFFIALTGKVDPSLSSLEKWVLFAALVAMSLSILSGIISWLADARWAYSGAQELKEAQAPSKPTVEQVEAAKAANQGVEYWRMQREFWHNVKRKTEVTIAIFFLLGVAAASLYIGSRLLDTRRSPPPNNSLQRTAGQNACQDARLGVA